MATTTSFKQPCPSCEHPVVIRDPKLIGRKTDCPKCKFRFLVEDPAGEEEPAKAAAVTASKPAANKAAPAKKPVRRRDDDDDDEDEKPKAKKKSGGSSPTLILGIGLGVVTVILLVVGILYMTGAFDSGSSTPTAGGGGTGSPAPNPGMGQNPGGMMPPPGGGAGADANNPQGEKPVDAVPPPNAELAYLSNLLPNDTESVLDAKMDKLINTPIGRDLTASFGVEQFSQRFGFPLESVKRIIQSSSKTKDWIFTLVHTNKTVDWEKVRVGLTLEKGPKSPINGREYFVIQGDLDPFSNIFIRNNRTKPLAAYRYDDHTVVLAEIEPMEKFLEMNAQPKHLSQASDLKPDEEAAPGTEPGGEGGAAGEDPRGPGAGGVPGGKGGAGGPPAGGPGAMGMGMGPGMGPGGPGAMGPGAMGPGAMGMGMGGPGGPGTEAPKPIVVHSWMSVKPDLKVLLDKADAVKPTSILTVGMEGAAAPQFADILGMFLVGNVEGLELSDLVKLIRGDLRGGAASFSVIKLNQLKGLAVLDFMSEEKPRAMDAGWKLALPLLASHFQKELGMRLAGAIPPNPNMMGGMMGPGGEGAMGPGGMMMPGTGTGMAPGGMMPPGGMAPGGMAPGGMMPPGGMAPGGMMPPGGGRGGDSGSPDGGPGTGGPGMGMPGMGGPGGFGGGQPGDSRGGSPDQSTMGLNVRNTTAVIDFDFRFPDKKPYDFFHDRFLEGIVRMKGRAEMVNSRPRIHELAAALKTYAQKRGTFPRGTAERPPSTERAGRPFPPNQRVSWMAEVLRYLPNYTTQYAGQTTVYPLEIDIAKSWREGTNLLAAQTLVGPFLSSKSTEETWWVSYPNQTSGMAATHFVGVAGLGLDAAEGGAPKSQGVFGYDRATALSQISDGPENTIAVLQVPPTYKAPWLSGGGSTVRGVPEKDSVKPFVCAEHGGKRGTFAIMANGEVRFIAEDIKDEDFKALCTIAGGERVDVNAVSVLVTAPRTEVKPPPAPPAPPATPPAAPEKPAPM